MVFKVFHALPVVAAEIKSNKLYSLLVIADDPDATDFEKSERFDVDLSLTPKRTDNWTTVQVDDRGENASGIELPPHMDVPLNITTIGSGKLDSPIRGAFVGVAYLEKAKFMALQPVHFPKWPPTTIDLERLTSLVVRTDQDDGSKLVTRYHGFVATVDSINGEDVTVKLSPPDTTFTFKKSGTSVLQDPPKEAFTSHSSLLDKLSVGQTGALFIELKAAVKAGLHRPKIPVGLGF